ncbi:hypothetical protein [Paraburkholderia caffeinilytica]|uniref:Secreted protein n=1 Tax=Paraburkholderia caffeinilytica TaxID=1761016 RepID=A0ABQ1MMZ3_9BURK|nr:hypothetical protein [Paraburkholderia caffeinilytica]GGC43425.1 hypothetical protein GCM10011400_33020 [Paraburkholderia caffeinilytica]
MSISTTFTITTVIMTMTMTMTSIFIAAMTVIMTFITAAPWLATGTVKGTVKRTPKATAADTIQVVSAANFSRRERADRMGVVRVSNKSPESRNGPHRHNPSLERRVRILPNGAYAGASQRGKRDENLQTFHDKLLSGRVCRQRQADVFTG